MAFLGAARFVKHTYGEAALQKIVDGAHPSTRETFSRRIDGLSLQPYVSFIGLLESADRELGVGDLAFCRRLGDLAARHDLRTIFQGYAIRPSPEEMIRACTPIWGMYTDGAGTMTAIDHRPERTILRINGFPEMAPAHCRLMEGWMIAAMDLVGARVLPGARETECHQTGGECH
jgi:hypothetical protein